MFDEYDVRTVLLGAAGRNDCRWPAAMGARASIQVSSSRTRCRLGQRRRMREAANASDARVMIVNAETRVGS